MQMETQQDSWPMRFLAILVLGALLVSCQKPGPLAHTREQLGRPPAGDAASDIQLRDVARTRDSGERQRVIAVGDVHGDLDSLRSALRLAGVIDHNDHWVGGSDILVQVGDFLDRGDDEPEIMDLLQQLSVEAQQASGGLYALLGNHETMNVQLDFRYVTTDGFADYADTPYQTSDTVVMDFPQQQRGRAAAFKPGGVEALRLSGQKVALQIGDTVFVHGGLLPDHALYGLDNLNDDVSAWMQGQRSEPVDLVGGDGPLWVRHYSSAPDQDDCALLQQTLSLLGARRMVVGHTVVSGITSACGQQVWLVDVGLSSYYGGGISVLELTGSAAQVLRL